jgi:uncharacterized protein (DUF983 family)
MPTAPERTKRVLARGFAARCPACGRGRIFRGWIETEVACRRCGRLFERCPGHWIGGAEIDLVASFAFGVAAFVPAALFLGLGPPAAIVATAATGVFSLAFYRPSRGLFIAIDYLLDPAPDVAPEPFGDGDGGGDCRDARRDRPTPRPPAPPDGAVRPASPVGTRIRAIARPDSYPRPR